MTDEILRPINADAFAAELLLEDNSSEGKIADRLCKNLGIPFEDVTRLHGHEYVGVDSNGTSVALLFNAYSQDVHPSVINTTEITAERYNSGRSEILTLRFETSTHKLVFVSTAIEESLNPPIVNSALVSETKINLTQRPPIINAYSHTRYPANKFIHPQVEQQGMVDVTSIENLFHEILTIHFVES